MSWKEAVGWVLLACSDPRRGFLWRYLLRNRSDLDRSRVKRLSIAAMLVISGGLIGIVGQPPSAQANPGSDWLPLVGNSIALGCTWDNGCAGGYHTSAGKAVDLVVGSGTPVYASGPGTLSSGGGCPNSPSSCNGGRGNYISINHGSHVSRYLHLSGFAVTSGQVGAGQLIGYSGNSGDSSGAHLHYDELVGGVKVDPGPLLVCHGATRQVLGVGGWNLLGRGTGLRNDGYACAAANPLVDGRFVARQGSPEVYVMAGESPVYVSTWDAFGGPRPVQVLSAAQFDALRQEPLDGTFIFGTRTGRVFSVAGGAPVYLSAWANVGGQAGKRVVGVDDWSIDNAGHPFSHLRARPKDGAFLDARPSGRIFVVAGGAPLYVSNWANVGGPRAVAPVDDWSVDNAGTPASHLNGVPDNGYYLVGSPSGRVFMTAWGAPVYLSDWARVGGTAGKPIVGVDDWVIDNAGHPSSHLRSRPPEGAFLVGRPSGRVFRVAGGSPLYVSSWARVGGAQATAAVDDWSFDNAGHASSRMLALPANGTLLRAQPSGRRWQVQSGQRFLSDGPGGLVVDEAGLERVPLRPGAPAVGGGGGAGGSTRSGGSAAGGTGARGTSGRAEGGAGRSLSGLKTSSAAAGRVLSVRVRVAKPGRLIVRLVRRGTKKTHPVARRKVESGTYRFRWRRPAGTAPGRFVVIVFFKPTNAPASQIRQAIRLR